MFIALEGIDACGKSTQIKLLSERLNAKMFRFPDDETPVGKLIRSHLNREWKCHHTPEELVPRGREATCNLNALVFQALHLANRLEKATEITQTMHTLGQDVVADRYLASAIVYGGADGLDVDYLVEVQQWLPQPDLNILLNIPPELSAERKPEKRDRYESQAGLMEEVADRYCWLWAKMTGAGNDNWVVVDGSQSVEKVHADIVEEVSRANQAK
jgi:dTMP kinase